MAHITKATSVRDWFDQRIAVTKLWNVLAAQYWIPKNINFVKTANYGYTFRAKVESEYNEESTKISQRDLIRRVVGRCLDKNIAKLHE